MKIFPLNSTKATGGKLRNAIGSPYRGMSRIWTRPWYLYAAHACPPPHDLTEVTGWSVPRHDFYVHHPVHSLLQHNLNEETAAPLHELIHKIGNTTFGDGGLTLPQWISSPCTIAYVQAILYESLAASFFPSFLAMTGGGQLNQCYPWTRKGPLLSPARIAGGSSTESSFCHL